MSAPATPKPRLTRATHPCRLVREWQCDGCFDCREPEHKAERKDSKNGD